MARSARLRRSPVSVRAACPSGTQGTALCAIAYGAAKAMAQSACPTGDR
ncbi:hypothetical protein [Scytonema sp. HK-05]|nr:hypothetical protein [Scytonema sp. HK-05]